MVGGNYTSGDLSSYLVFSPKNFFNNNNQRIQFAATFPWTILPHWSSVCSLTWMSGMKCLGLWRSDIHHVYSNAGHWECFIRVISELIKNVVGRVSNRTVYRPYKAATDLSLCLLSTAVIWGWIWRQPICGMCLSTKHDSMLVKALKWKLALSPRVS